MISAEFLDYTMPTRTIELAEGIVKHGYQVTLLCNGGRFSKASISSLFLNIVPAKVVKNGVTWLFPPAVHLPSGKGLLRPVLGALNIVLTLAFATLLLCLRAIDVDILCASSAHSQGVIASALKALFHKELVTDYGDPTFARETGLMMQVSLFLERISIARSDVVVSTDPVISKYILSNYHKEPVFLPSGYDSALFPRAECHSQRSLADRFVTFVGKIDTSVYRLDILLLASKRVVDAIPEARFRLIGAGPDIGKLKRMASDLGVQRSIDFVGFVPHENVASWICESEVCVHMTNDTCLGMKVMEYMVSRKPTIIAALWWNKYESVIKSGYNCITVPLDPEALAAAILKVMRDGDYAAKLGRNAYETARHYSWDQISEGVIKEIQRIGNITVSA